MVLLPQGSEARNSTTGLISKDPVNNDIIRGIELLYDLEFDKAEDLFSKVIAENRENSAGYFYLAMVTWSRLTSGFWSSDVVEEFAQRIDRSISIAEKKIEKGKPDSFTYFYLGGALGFKGRFELMRHKWLSSFNLAYQAVRALETCLRMDPKNRDVLLGLGIFDYYTARLSGVLKFLTYLLLHRGDKEEGLRKLHTAADEAVYSAIEAKSMLIHIYLFMEEDYRKALPFAKELAEKFTKNPRHKFFEGIVYIRQGRKPEYRAVLDYFRRRSLNENSRASAAIWQNQALYLEACYLLFREQYEQARSTLTAILSQADPLSDPSMIAWPLLKKGMSYDLEGNREIALEYYNQVLEMENGAGAQFLAEKCIDEPVEKGDPFLGY
jgi:tetratricopeptide (TPR) repeat protein